MFGTGRASWRPDLPDASNEPLVPLLWLKVHKLLGRVRAGSTARFIQDGTLPGDTRHVPTSTGSPAGEVTALDTDQLEHDMNQLCHE